jgi:PIN domain nuclease of toxin-antitoxin system
MQYLLDTHTLLWYLEDSDKLPSKTNQLIKNESNTCAVSVVSLFEIAIKINIKKLNIGFNVSEIVRLINKEIIDIIPIKTSHVEYLSSNTFHHKDPFDKLILSTAVVDE